MDELADEILLRVVKYSANNQRLTVTPDVALVRELSLSNALQRKPFDR